MFVDLIDDANLQKNIIYMNTFSYFPCVVLEMFVTLLSQDEINMPSQYSRTGSIGILINNFMKPRKLRMPMAGHALEKGFL